MFNIDVAFVVYVSNAENSAYVILSRESGSGDGYALQRVYGVRGKRFSWKFLKKRKKKPPAFFSLVIDFIIVFMVANKLLLRVGRKLSRCLSKLLF